MTRTQYLAALKTLGLTPASKRTAEALGLSVRQCQRIASGESDVPGAVAKLLKCPILVDRTIYSIPSMLRDATDEEIVRFIRAWKR